MNILLIDADSLVWQSCFCKKEVSSDGFIHDIDEATHKFDEGMFDMFNRLDEMGYSIDKYKVFVGGHNNFRKIVNSDYKANRMFQPKPPRLDDVKFHAISAWGAYVCNGVEADDVVVATRKHILDTDFSADKNVIVASIDKDYKQVPNLLFYNYHSMHLNLSLIEEAEAVRFFFMQMLMGDSSDNVVGIRGVGEKKADKILGSGNAFTYLRRAYQAYKDAYKGKASQMFRMNAAMLRLVDEGIAVPDEDEFDNV